jgi:hypothetical protein
MNIVVSRRGTREWMDVCPSYFLHFEGGLQDNCTACQVSRVSTSKMWPHWVTVNSARHFCFLVGAVDSTFPQTNCLPFTIIFLQCLIHFVQGKEVLSHSVSHLNHMLGAIIKLLILHLTPSKYKSGFLKFVIWMISFNTLPIVKRQTCYFGFSSAEAPPFCAPKKFCSSHSYWTNPLCTPLFWQFPPLKINSPNHLWHVSMCFDGDDMLTFLAMNIAQTLSTLQILGNSTCNAMLRKRTA